jgi:4-hydroxybenzoate polyprenyltransferase
MLKRGASVYLRLGRVSNLPTVWTNAVAGALLAGARPGAGTLLTLALALSAYYVGGMYLNDGFDRDIDARERPERPIPSGLVSARRVFTIGFGLLAFGLAGVAGVSARPAPILAGVALGATIVLYDAWHKANPLSPVIMGLCRVLVYFTAALAVSGRLAPPVLAGAACLLAYLIGLTYVAKHENKPLVARTWPLLGLAAPVVYVAYGGVGTSNLVLLAAAGLAVWIFAAVRLLRSKAPKRIPRAVSSLIAGIALVDAALLARSGASVTVVLIVALGCLATRLFQRYVPGT